MLFELVSSTNDKGKAVGDHEGENHDEAKIEPQNNDDYDLIKPSPKTVGRTRQKTSKMN